tara:strand:+ start:9548 stop:9982 length:435 start_codon:yes stop_codon:yes gene_type:complete
MDPEIKLYLINKNISPQLLKINSESAHQIDFTEYKEIEIILKKTTATSLIIYDQTKTTDPIGTVYPVNDHINRIGHNPFIGHQKDFNIDFINIEKLYTQHPNGIVTDSCGSKNFTGKYPSTHLSNIAILAKVFQLKINAFLINI